jgi:hypothetical protein
VATFVLAGRAWESSLFLGLSAATLVVALATVFRAAHALVEPLAAEQEARVTGRRRRELEREKASLLKALKELEFDHEMGKIGDADFREIGGQYRGRAMRVYRQLDEAGADYRALVEKELKARLAAQGDAPRAAPSARDGSCSGCGTRNDADAVFCKKCGRRVTGEAEVGA